MINQRIKFNTPITKFIIILLIGGISAAATLFIDAKVIGLLVVITIVFSLLLINRKKVLRLFFALFPGFWIFGNIDILIGSGHKINPPMFIGGFVTLISIWFLHKLKNYKNEKLLVICFCLFTLPAIITSKNILTGFGVYLRIISPFLLFIASIYWAKSLHDGKKMMKAMLLSALFVPIMLIVGLQRGDLFYSLGGFIRLRGTYLPTQTFGLFLVMLLIIALGYYSLIKRSLLNTLGFTAISMFLIGCIFLTYYRTAWISAIIVVSIFCIFDKHNYVSKVIFFCILLFAVFNISELWNLLIRYVPKIENQNDINALLSGRILINDASIKYYKLSDPLHKIFGIGFYSSRIASEAYLGYSASIHSDYLSYFIESGPISLLLYIVFILINIISTRKQLIKKGESQVKAISIVSLSCISILLIAGSVGAFYTNVLSGWYLFSLLGLQYGVSANEASRKISPFPVI